MTTASEHSDARMDALVARAKRSERLTSALLADHVDRFLRDHRPAVIVLAGEAVERGIKTVYFRGSGGSFSTSAC